jgi:Cytochrome P450
MVSGVGEAYLDSLLDMEVEGKEGGLGEDELVTLCSEVMSAGTDTSATSLEWIMLQLVLDPTVQDRLYKEIVSTVGTDKSRKITETDVESMTYLQVLSYVAFFFLKKLLYIFSIQRISFMYVFMVTSVRSTLVPVVKIGDTFSLIALISNN